MNEKKNKMFLDTLNQIEEVEVPPFLFTRIKERIRYNSETATTPKIKLSLGISLSIILVLNIFAVYKGTNNIQHQDSLVQSMNLLPDNNLYK